MAIPRIDAALVERGLAGSLDEARLLVMEGKVYLGGGKAEKASDKAKPGLVLTVRDNKLPYVSRGGYKLARALEAFGVDARGRVCVDVGASTGGFTDVLLQAGAARVYAVDVGFGLLDWRLRSDARVTVMEKTNARGLTGELFDPRPSLGVTDVSFISLEAVLPPALCVLAGARRFVALVKPQFEARREDVGQGGVVRDSAVHEKVLGRIVRFVDTLGWQAQGLDVSPITGAEGNIEFLLDIVPREADGARGGLGCAPEQLCEADIARVVARAWARFHPDAEVER